MHLCEELIFVSTQIGGVSSLQARHVRQARLAIQQLLIAALRHRGPGWALVGDAGYHEDPYLAQGISDGFRNAELLADALDAGFSGRQLLDDALAGYEAQRNSSAMPLYELNYQLASLQPPSPEQQQLFGALYGNQADTDRFFGTLCGTVPVQEFFDSDNLGRIMAGASAPATMRA